MKRQEDEKKGARERVRRGASVLSGKKEVRKKMDCSKQTAKKCTFTFHFATTMLLLL